MIRCIIVDDSPLALDLLEDYIGKTGFLELAGRFTNALEAVEFLKSGHIDLVFLDIQMPDITGIEMLKSLKNKPAVIFTTAFEFYAVEGFELNAVDYLLKPISFERFKRAADKMFHQYELEKISNSLNQVIFVRSGYETLKIKTAEIQYIEALKDYIQIFTQDQKILSLMSMKEILELLPQGEFVRIHRSYIIPVDKISGVAARKVLLDKKEFPVGDIFKDEFQKLIRARKIIK
jgi:DNA-binding LytR/AlgR family response regulator